MKTLGKSASFFMRKGYRTVLNNNGSRRDPYIAPNMISTREVYAEFTPVLSVGCLFIFAFINFCFWPSCQVTMNEF